MQIQNKIIVVTGGGNGIGRELVLNLLAKGAKVAAVDLNENHLEETKKLASDKAINLSLHVLNIADKAAVDALPQQVITQHGVVDGLINCAGIIQPFVRINDLDLPTIERVMNVNFYGTLYMVKAFLPILLKRPEGYVANVSSMGGFLPVPGQSVYGASKAAVKLLTEGLYAELMNSHVHVSIVFPGAIGTNIIANSGAENKHIEEASKNSKIKPLSPVAAAEIIIAGMQKNKYRIFVGKDSKLLDLMYRWNPTFATRMVSKQMKDLLE